MDLIVILKAALGFYLIYLLAKAAGRATQDNIAMTGSHTGIWSYGNEQDKNWRNFCRAEYGQPWHPDYPDDQADFRENFRGDQMAFEPLGEGIEGYTEEEEAELRAKIARWRN